MTLQEAKHQTAKEEGYDSWEQLLMYQAGAMRLLEKAAELYASSLRSELAEREGKISGFNAALEDFKQDFKKQLAEKEKAIEIHIKAGEQRKDAQKYHKAMELLIRCHDELKTKEVHEDDELMYEMVVFINENHGGK